MRKVKKIPLRVPEGETIEDQDDFSMEELNMWFKKRMKEYQHFVNMIVNQLGLMDEAKILEIGPGPAWITILLAKKNSSFKITGLEISEAMIRVAKKNILEAGVEEQISFVLGDAKNMVNISNRSYDAIITHDSLHHWEDPISVFNEISRIINEKGKFYISDGRRDLGIGAKIIFNLIRFFIPKEMRYYWKTSIMAGYTPDEIQIILDQTSLKNQYEIRVGLFDLIIISKNSSK